MKLALPLSKSDLLLLRNAAVSCLMLCVISVLLVLGSNQLQTTSNQNLLNERAGYEQVVTSVMQIAQEEETITRFIDRYRQIASDGVLAAEDRLALLEQMTTIREQYQLYPMQVLMEEQVSHVLSYPPEDPLPGEPVSIQQTTINVSLPLLHEGDLLRAMDDILNLPALLQPVDCVLDMDAGLQNGMSQLRENLVSVCRLHWYTFNLEPTPVLDQGAF
jgi:hypothetical protein